MSFNQPPMTRHSTRGDGKMQSVLHVSQRGQRRAGRSRSTCRQHPMIESLEGREMLSWGSVPPATIPVPPPAVAVGLNSLNDAQGTAAIVSDEVDYYTFVARSSGNYVI